MTSAPDSPDALLESTRSAVLNLMVAAGLGIAASGFLLRWRDRWALTRAPESVRTGLTTALVVLAVTSFLVRRVVSGRGALRDPAARPSRFYRGHVASAALAALAVPLGLAFGWFVRPRLDAVAPFWAVALTLGLLAFPRAYELDGLDDFDRAPDAGPHEPQS